MRRGQCMTPEMRTKFCGENNSFFGKHHSEETKRKLAESSQGNKNCLGVHPSDETRKKQSVSHQKHVPSDETKQKISLANKKRFSDPLERARISSTLKKKYEDLTEREKFKTRAPTTPKSKEHRGKISTATMGNKNHNWAGGISFEPYCPKFNKDLRKRIRAFFEYRCVTCGKTEEENIIKLSCHHVSYNKNACCDSKPVHFASLCVSCHSKTNHDRIRWENMINRIINDVYNGRSYFTSDEWRILNAK